MGRILQSIAILTALAGVASAADVHVGINLGVPVPPPIVVTAPPPLVVVPAVPTVQYAPSLGFNYFAYGGSYYTYDDGAWFMAPAYNGPWGYVERRYVPRPVLGVPVRYYNVPPGHGERSYRGHPHGMPPGQAKKLYGDKPGKGHKHWD